SLRHTLRRQPPDQRPILQSDHSPIVECSLFTATTVQFSTAADISAPGEAVEFPGRVEITD
ncbi:hypothetical protein, partial [Herbiconiux moechotypicola]|uniref:hypothetical protein n=1 Tax=Herbiconiux moechotypicola TaxID=637393 RepID=UPI0031DFFE1A